MIADKEERYMLCCSSSSRDEAPCTSFMLIKDAVHLQAYTNRKYYKRKLKYDIFLLYFVNIILL